MYRSLVKALTVLLLLITPSTVRAVMVPAGLNPGDPYHLVFITQGTQDAVDLTIGPYNSFVQTQAALNPILTGTDLGVQWSVIGSTSSINARDNAVVGTNVPVYLVDGTTKIADGFADIWDGDIDNPIDVDQFGVTISGIFNVHTGTDTAGFSKLSPARYLGSTLNVGTGGPDLATGGWIANGGAGLNTTFRPFYALSQQLSVPVPEPTTFGLAALGVCGFLLRRHRND